MGGTASYDGSVSPSGWIIFSRTRVDLAIVDF